jgi:hypothetical protein
MGLFCGEMPGLLHRLNTALDRIWPPAHTTRLRLDLLALTLAGGLALGWALRDAPLLGHDWLVMYFANRATDVYYPPWTSIILRPLASLPWRSGLALLNGLTIAAVAIYTFHQGTLAKNPARVAATLLAILTPQVAIVLWAGQIDGLAVLGILGLPWLAPLVLMKATFVGFSVLASKHWFLAALGCGLLSWLLWPGWPAQLIATLAVRGTHLSAAGWPVTGWLPPLAGLVLLLLSQRTDWLQMVAAGSLLYPFSLPYHWIVLLPALGGLRGRELLASWLAAWLMLIPIGLNAYHWLYFVFPFVIWWQRQRQPGHDDSWLALLREVRQAQRM